MNPEDRAQRAGFKAGVTPEEFTAAAMQGLEADAFEIGYGMTAGMLQASWADLDDDFQQMNGRW